MSYKPFPRFALPDVAANYITQASESIGCDEAYIALPLISALASAVGNTQRIQLKNDWREPCIVWTAVIGESGTHKTPAQRLALQYLQDKQKHANEQFQVQQEQYEIEQLDYEDRFKAWRKSKNSEQPIKPQSPILRRYLCNDITVEALTTRLQDNPRGIMIVRDELAGFFESMDAYKQGSGDVAQYLEMFQGNPMQVDRKSGNTPVIYVPKASVSITGGIQPDALRRSLGKRNIENGLAARFLMANPPRKAKQWTDSIIEHQTIQRMGEVFDALLNLSFIGEDEPNSWPLTDDAQSLWIDFYNEHNQQQSNLAGELAAAWSKLEAYAARFALLIHLVRIADQDCSADMKCVDVTSMLQAIELINWFCEETKRVYGMLREDGESKDTRELVSFIEKQGGIVSLRELMRSGPCFKNADLAKRKLETLVSVGVGKWVSPSSNKNGGRPTFRFQLIDVTDTDNNPNIKQE